MAPPLGTPGEKRSTDEPSGASLPTDAPTRLATGATTAHAFEEQAGDVIGSYKLLEKLGEGGFGVVWAASQDEPIRRRVALKIIKLGMDSKQVVARFEQERQTLALLNHPNIASILDAGITGFSPGDAPPSQQQGSQLRPGRPFFVMELVRGLPITEYCERHKLPVRERLALFIKVCCGIQHAHQKGIIHRDIKPSNILVTLPDQASAGVPKVIDFGIAKATQQELTELTIFTQQHQFIGTPAYMSPEQAEMSGLDIDTRSDIYSLGVLLYELLTGTTPFETQELIRGGIDEMRRMIRERDPVRPSTRLTQRRTTQGAAPPRAVGVDSLASDLDWIVMRCLEKDRTRRYETANGLGMDIQRHLDDEPIVARPPSALYRLQKAWRRNRLAYAAALVVACGFFAGVVGITLGFMRARQAQAEAVRVRDTLYTNLYFTKIALAHSELGSTPPTLRVAESLLEECPEPLRNWEWHHLKQRRFAEPVVLREPSGMPVQCVDFSGDGKLLAAGTSDGRLHVWNVAAQPTLLKSFQLHTGFVAAVAFNPRQPGIIATTGFDGKALVLDWVNGKPLRSFPSSSTFDYGMSQSIAFSPDGQRLAIPEAGDAVGIHSLTGAAPPMRLAMEVGTARCVTFSPNSKWIVTGGSKGQVRLWEASSGALLGILDSNTPPVAGVRFSADSKRLCSLVFAGRIRVWDIRDSGNFERRNDYQYRNSGNPHTTLRLHPRGDRVFVGTLDRMVAMSDPETGRQVLVFRDLTGGCYGLGMSPDGSRVAAASRSGAVHLWDSSTLPDPSLGTLHYATRLDARALDVSSDGKSIAVSGFGAPEAAFAKVPIEIFTDIQAEPRSIPGHDIVCFCLAFHPNNRWLASAGDDRVGGRWIHVWDLAAGRDAYWVENVSRDGRFFSLRFSPDGRHLVGGGNDETKGVHVWDAHTGRYLGPIGAHQKEVASLAFSPNGRFLASFGNDDFIKLWDGRRLTTRQTPLRVFRGFCSGFGDALAFSPDNRRLAYVADDHNAVIQDLESADRRVVLTAAHHRPMSLIFGPDGKWIASGGADATVRIWDATTGALRITHRSHTDLISRLRLAKLAEGPRLISSSRDNSAKFWPFPD